MAEQEITADTVLPGLRQELQLLGAADDGGGGGGYLIFDPVRHKYFRIGQVAARILSVWCKGTAGRARAALAAQGLIVALDEFGALLRFVAVSGLLASPPQGSEGLARERAAARRNPFVWLVHNYLFFRVPLVRPEKFLNGLLPAVSWLGSRAALWLFVLVTLAGIYMAGHQWETFRTTFLYFFSWQGAVLYGLTLVFTKTIHELGHALVATWFGCRVPSMGVAFLVMLPMLYTDVTDAWKLTQRRQRLLIDAAGMLSELALAGVALLAWAFLPDGPARSAAFFLATTAWIVTLVINLSPFMRFDGYHILADALGIHNLQPRGFAMGKWKMREVLFGLGRPAPEVFRPAMARLLIAYAWGTWVYRFLLFLGIAVLVYFLFFKVLGIVLFAVEIIWFIAMPVFKEVTMWWHLRALMVQKRRAWLTFAAVAGGLSVMFVPLQSSVYLSGVAGVETEAQIFAPEPARLVRVGVVRGQSVDKGQVLFELTSDQIEFEERKNRLDLAIVRHRLARGVADRLDLARRAVLLREQAALEQAARGIAARRARLLVRAPVGGHVTSLATGLRAGLWVNGKAQLAHVAGRGAIVVRALVDGHDVARLAPGDEGWFYPGDAAQARWPVRVLEIGLSKGAGHELEYLASASGGDVAVQKNPAGQIKTSRAYFPVRLLIIRAPAEKARSWPVAVRGHAVVAGVRQSLAHQMMSRVAAVFLREAGF